MHGARSVPPADKNEQADEQIKQAHDSQIVFRGKGLLGRRREEGSFEFLAIAGKLIMHLAPKSRTIHPAGNFSGSGNTRVIDGQEDITRANPGAGCGRIR